MLTSKAVNSLNVNDDKLNRIQQNIITPLTQVLESQVIDGVLVENITCVADAPVAIKHGMGRTNVHVVVVNCFGDNQISLRRASRTGNDPNYITVTPSASGSIDVWIF